MKPKFPYTGDDSVISVPLFILQNFNPRPPARGTTCSMPSSKVRHPFQSTSPYAGDDGRPKATNGTRCYFNPRPPTRGTTEIPFEALWKVLISIHVPLRGGRQHRKRQIAIGKRFQSTSPYAGDDITAASSRGKQITFQSTSPYAGDDSKTVQNLWGIL